MKDVTRDLEWYTGMLQHPGTRLDDAGDQDIVFGWTVTMCREFPLERLLEIMPERLYSIFLQWLEEEIDAAGEDTISVNRRIDWKTEDLFLIRECLERFMKKHRTC